MQPDYLLRCSRIESQFESLAADGFLITNLTNVRYLSGFTGSNAALLISPKSSTLITDGRYRDQAAAQSPQVAIEINRNCPAAGVQLAEAQGSRALAIESQHMSLDEYRNMTRAYPAMKFIETRGIVERLRRAKDDYEIAQISAACDVISSVVTEMMSDIRVGMTERQIAAILEQRVIETGAERSAFDSIVAAGTNSAVPHHEPTERQLMVGDWLKIDAGARVAGYCSDMTRTFVVGAEPTEAQQDLHATVAAAADAARAKVAPEVSARVPDSTARAALGKDVAHFTHGLGHGLGLQIHEAPYLGSRTADTMAVGDILTIEPGVYLPGYGGVRIEDTLLVTEAGSRCLTTATRDLVRLG